MDSRVAMLCGGIMEPRCALSNKENMGSVQLKPIASSMKSSWPRFCRDEMKSKCTESRAGSESPSQARDLVGIAKSRCRESSTGEGSAMRVQPTVDVKKAKRTESRAEIVGPNSATSRIGIIEPYLTL